MAQVRDAQTSEAIFEGTPLECVLVSREIGEREVIFDDVGVHFDPDAVLKAAHENADGLEAEASQDDKMAEHAKAARAALAPHPGVSQAKAHLEAARKAREEAMRVG